MIRERKYQLLEIILLRKDAGVHMVIATFSFCISSSVRGGLSNARTAVGRGDGSPRFSSDQQSAISNHQTSVDADR